MTEIADMQLLRKGKDNQTLNLNPITALTLIISVTSEPGILIPSLSILICENTGLLTIIRTYVYAYLLHNCLIILHVILQYYLAHITITLGR